MRNRSTVGHLELRLIKKKIDWMRMNQNYSTISNLEPWFFPEFVLPFDAYKIKP
ncbi:hypothetical protein B296_00045497 [Ensete ventricosum]|uniref:Uncharacterized protein n=1 Tax=Ensete ventricosum TaxID=4639 RepID=A0A426X9B4_ENSVE|nr:hypothetical protein B296_00045497 [Ensete ventricosum]